MHFGQKKNETFQFKQRKYFEFFLIRKQSILKNEATVKRMKLRLEEQSYSYKNKATRMKLRLEE